MTGVRGALGIAAVAVATSGCIGFQGPERVRHEIAADLDWKLEREMGVTVRRSGVWLARKIMRWSGDEDAREARALLDGVRRVQVGVYEVRPRERGTPEPSLCAHEFRDWTPMVRVCEDDEQTLLLAPDPDDLRELVVLVRDDEEMVVVSLKGDLERAFERTLEWAREGTVRHDGSPSAQDAPGGAVPAAVLEPAHEVRCERWTGSDYEACDDPESTKRAVRSLGGDWTES